MSLVGRLRSFAVQQNFKSIGFQKTVSQNPLANACSGQLWNSGTFRNHLLNDRFVVPRIPIILERLSIDGDGLMIQELKQPIRDETTSVLFEPLDFFARLATLVPRPRTQLVCYHGLFVYTEGICFELDLALMESITNKDKNLRWWRRVAAPCTKAGWHRCAYVAAAAFIYGFSTYPSQYPDFVLSGFYISLALILHVTIASFFVKWWHGLIYLFTSFLLFIMSIPHY